VFLTFFDYRYNISKKSGGIIPKNEKLLPEQATVFHIVYEFSMRGSTATWLVEAKCQ
jgi:hypothetical protein